MSCVCLLSLAALLACARAYEDMPAAPQALEPEVAASEGGTATLRCLFHGNPPPKITWRFRAYTIDGNADRYRLMSDGALEINPLYRSDTGVYICVAKNDYGVAMQEVHLVLEDLAPEKDCSQFREEYEQALVCQYGYHTSTLDGCKRWKCKENPCVRANCSSSQHCEAVELSSPSSQGVLYSTRCVAGGVCDSFKQECNELNCRFGIQKFTDADGCERCKCRLNPCEKTSCAAGKRCVVLNPMPSIGQVSSAICGTMVKAGATEDTSPYMEKCYIECRDDASCRGVGKCCLRGCSCLCLLPVGQTSTYLLTTAYFGPGLYIENELLVPRNMVVPRPRTQRPTTAETTTTTTSTTTEAPRPMFTVPVSTHVSWPSPTLYIGADLHLTCEVDGFPEPDVHWTKDGNTVQTDGRITITGSTIVSRLTVMRVTVADSGLYACHARNPYSSQSDTAQINVQQLVVPAKCTDNPFFANCDLIVRSKFCRHKYYSKFCCKSCVEAGQLDPQEAELQADQPLRKK